MFTTAPTRALGALALLGSLSLTACDSGEPGDDPGPEELITQVTLTLTPVGGGSAVTITASDDDGDGADITFSPSSLALMPGTTYNGSIRLRDTINDEDITEEIEEESEEHLFRYSFDPSSLGTVTITDTESDYTTDDENGGDFAVGLDFEVTTAASGSGDLVVVLYHFDEGPKTSSTDESDETDVDIDFPITIQGAAVAGQ